MASYYRSHSESRLSCPMNRGDNASDLERASRIAVALGSQDSAGKEAHVVPRRALGVLLAAILVVAGWRQPSAAAQTTQPLTGTWKLNPAKSTFDPADLSAPHLLVTYEVNGDQVTASLDGIDSRRRAVHSEYTATFDGRAHPITSTVDGRPAPNQDAIAWRKIDDRTYEAVTTTNGRVISRRRIVVAADGRSRTTEITGRDAQGRAVHHLMFFDRQ